MKTTIQYKEVFFEKLRTGINLFTGAGFSVLPSPSGKTLPTAKELAHKICDEFEVPGTLADDLELVSTKARIKDAKRFDEFLRSEYRVSEANELYDVINNINIRNYITTNIDNLFQTVIEKDPEKYVNSVVHGKARRSGKVIDYIPLHGDITDSESQLYFGSFEIARAASENNRMFSIMENEVYKYPTLFWGYGFHDSSVMSTLGSILIANAKNVWIQFTKENADKAETYRGLGFNIIIGNTDDLLSDLLEQFKGESAAPQEKSPNGIPKIWEGYLIPTQNQLKVNIGAIDYFRDGKMAWNVFFSKHPYETLFVKEAYVRYLKCKNLIIVGSPQCGKTTLLRQLSLEIGQSCYYFSELSKAQAEKLTRSLVTEISVFVDDCTKDMEAFAVMARHSKIHLVGITDENGYESSKHLISDVEYNSYMLPDLSKEEANRVYEHIPSSIRKNNFEYTRSSDEKYSFLEFGFDNIRDIISKDKVENFLSSIDDSQIRNILYVTAYLNKNGSFLSTDVLWRFIGANGYSEVEAAIKKTNQALAEISESIDKDLQDQDYYILRSNSFSRFLVETSIEKHKREFASSIRKLIEDVPRGMITRYDVYRRTAYDANLFHKIFGPNAEDLYDTIYSFDQSPYTLQQKALYLSHNHKFNEAFSLIDKASQDMPNNFSIMNAKAIITFEANKNSREPEAKSQLDKAMAILSDCYRSDKRKVYHAQKYAQYALFISQEYNDAKYLNTALEWLETVAVDCSVRNNTTRLIEKVKREINDAWL